MMAPSAEAPGSVPQLVRYTVWESTTKLFGCAWPEANNTGAGVAVGVVGVGVGMAVGVFVGACAVRASRTALTAVASRSAGCDCPQAVSSKILRSQSPKITEAARLM